MTLLEQITHEITATGPMGFARYLELALYHPELGFYATSGAGRRRDFITSVEVGPLFGMLVGRALDERWTALGSPSAFSVVEVGAGRGMLARSVLRSGPRCVDALDYTAVETSVAQRAEHPAGVRSASTMPRPGGDGVVIANELLDNLPFDLWEFEGDGWYEVRVDVADGRLIEVAVEAAPPPALASVLGHRPAVVGDGDRVRVPDQAAARAWLADATTVHDRGTVIVIDYAVPAYPAAADREWLRTYRDHERGSDPLLMPGSRDITVDVAIDQLAAVRPPDRIGSQADWLRRLGIEALVDEGRRYWHDHAAAPDLAAFAARSRVGEADALLDPAGLGGFTVLEWDVGLDADATPEGRLG